MYQWVEQCLKEEYQLVREIKKTENGQTLVMRHRKLGEKIVVKYFEGDNSVYRHLMSFSHKNLPAIYEVVQDEKKCMVLQEYVEGITVGEILQSGLYHPRGVREVVRQVCEAVDCLHTHNVIHRDIKPENIIVDMKGQVKLLDYDAARMYKPEETADTKNLGTVGYAAPEQYGIMQTDYRADIYAIGVLINVMLTGEHPSRQFCNGRYRSVVSKCTQINPQNRYDSVKKLMKRL